MGLVSRGARLTLASSLPVAPAPRQFLRSTDVYLPAATVLCDQNSNNFHKHVPCFQTESSSCLAWDSAVQLLTWGPHAADSPCLRGQHPVLGAEALLLQ